MLTDALSSSATPQSSGLGPDHYDRPPRRDLAAVTFAHRWSDVAVIAEAGVDLPLVERVRRSLGDAIDVVRGGRGPRARGRKLIDSFICYYAHNAVMAARDEEARLPRTAPAFVLTDVDTACERATLLGGLVGLSYCGEFRLHAPAVATMRDGVLVAFLGWVVRFLCSWDGDVLRRGHEVEGDELARAAGVDVKTLRLWEAGRPA